MTKMITTEVELQFSTGDCNRGPKIQYSVGELILTYDHEFGDADSEATLKFNGAVAVRFIPDFSVSEYMITAYSKVCRYINSDWLVELSAEAAKHAAKLPQDRHHFFVYFDHYGCVEVIAKNVEV